jgi:hypothetical protein
MRSRSRLLRCGRMRSVGELTLPTRIRKKRASYEEETRETSCRLLP